MTYLVTQSFIPGPRLIDGTSLNNLVAQINAAVAQSAVLPIPITLANLANGQKLQLPVPFGFQVTAAVFTVQVPATTASKLATLTVCINGTNVAGGGVMALTSANCTPAGNQVAATTITGTNVGAQGALLGVAVTSVTTFAEGTGVLTFTVVPN